MNMTAYLTYIPILIGHTIFDFVQSTLNLVALCVAAYVCFVVLWMVYNTIRAQWMQYKQQQEQHET